MSKKQTKKIASTSDERESYRQLNARRKLFVHEYMKDLDGKAAAIRAGYSPRTAAETAYRLLNKDASIKAAIAYRTRALAKRSELKAERVIEELKRIAFADVTKLIELGADGELTLKELARLSSSVTSAIASVQKSKSGEVTVKMHDKLKALEMLCKYLNLFTERVEVTAKGIGLVLNLGAPGEDSDKGSGDENV